MVPKWSLSAQRGDFDGYRRDLGRPQSAPRHPRRHRNSARRHAGEVRARQEIGRADGRSLPAHRHVLSGKLRLHPADLVGRRRSLRRAGGEPGAGGARRGRALPAGRRAGDEGRSRRRREDHRGAGRRARPVLQGRTQLPRPAADHVRADRSFLPALQGPGKGKWVTIVKWLDVKAAEQLVLDAIARAGKPTARPEARSSPPRSCRGR